MTAAADYSYLGSGKVFGRIAGSSAGLLHLGNCSVLNLAISEETKELKDFTQGGGGLYNSVKRISGVELGMTLHDLNADNLAMATFGTSAAIAAGSVSNEASGAGYKNALLPTIFPLDTTQTVTVVPTNASAAARINSTAYTVGQYYTPAAPNGFFYKCTTAGTSAASPPTFGTTIGGTTTDGTATFTNVGSTTLIANTDYTITAAGPEFTAAATIYDTEQMKVTYTKSAGFSIESLLKSAQKYELVFAGLNEARSGKAVNVRIHKCTFGPAGSIDLIGEDYAGMEMTGKVEKDTTKNGTTISQYFKTDIVT